MSKVLPFPWQIRLSGKAKRPRITISAHGLVELIWPKLMSQTHAYRMLEQHQSWVLKHLQQIRETRPVTSFPPKQLYFQALDQNWTIEYEQTAHKNIKISEKEQVLHVRGDLQDQEAIRAKLCQWVRIQGQLHLSYWLADVAENMQLNYHSLAIRLQKRRWGSCSSSRRINLNAALLFLPPMLVEHVMVHELTHLNHLNHSAQFWAGVEKHDEHYLKHRRLLRRHAADVPHWLTDSIPAEW